MTWPDSTKLKAFAELIKKLGPYILISSFDTLSYRCVIALNFRIFLDTLNHHLEQAISSILVGIERHQPYYETHPLIIALLWRLKKDKKVCVCVWKWILLWTFTLVQKQSDVNEQHSVIIEEKLPNVKEEKSAMKLNVIKLEMKSTKIEKS